jgi:hypothetical protein
MKEDLFYLILSDNKFNNAVIKQFPGLYSYITSFRQNASEEHNQVCKDKIFKFYECNEYFKKFVSNYLNENQNSLRVDGHVIEVKNKDLSEGDYFYDVPINKFKEVQVIK